MRLLQTFCFDYVYFVWLLVQISFTSSGKDVQFISGFHNLDRNTVKNTLMTKMMKAALIGVGGHGQIHLRAIARMEEEGLMRLVAVADPFREKQLEVAENLASQGVSWFPSDDEMLSSVPDLEVIIISTPIHLHESMLLRALQYPQARILLEKPATATYGQLENLIAADPDTRVRVGYQTLFLPQIQILKEKLLSGDLGDVREVRAVGAWPRDTAYYQRAGWSGRMALGDQPIFDGPASNAMGTVLLTQGSLCSSGGCHDIPREEVEWQPDGIVRIKDISGHLRRFLENPADSDETEWLRCGPFVEREAISNLKAWA